MKAIALAAVAVILGQGRVAAQTQGRRTVTYEADGTTNFCNPERGFLAAIYPEFVQPPQPTRAVTDADGRAARKQGYSTIAVRYCLWPWRARSLDDVASDASGHSILLDSAKRPQSFLQRLRQDFETARRNGVKLNVRFSYNYADGVTAGQSDTTKAWVLTHIGQLLGRGSRLGPVLGENADVLAFLDLGFIGKWGEENLSSGGLVDEPAAVNGRYTANANTRAIIEALPAKLPETRQMATRYPSIKQTCFNRTNASASAEWGAPWARVGYHDDSFLASADDNGTFYPYPDVASNKQFVADDTRFVVMSGEPYGGATGDAGFTAGDGAAALREFAARHYDHFNAEHDDRASHPAYYDAWKKQGVFAEMQRRLGYRARLVSSTMPDTAAPGSAISIEFTIANDGWGKFYNPRPVNVVFWREEVSTRKHREKYVIATDANPRGWRPGEKKTETCAVTLPAEMVAGRYDVYLWLPDASARLADDVRYAVRFANGRDQSERRGSVWDAETGFNWLARVTVR